MDEENEGMNIPFDELLDEMFEEPLHIGLVPSLAAIGESLTQWREDPQQPREQSAGFGTMLSAILQRIGQLFEELVDAAEHEVDDESMPGVRVLLNWVGSSIQAAHQYLGEAGKLAQSGEQWDQVGENLNISLYYTAATAALMSAIEELGAEFEDEGDDEELDEEV